MRAEFENIDLGIEPRLLVGWRASHRRLKAQRVKLHQDVVADLAELCGPALEELSTSDERPYENFAALDDAEYFWYGHSEIPMHPPLTPAIGRDAPTAGEDTADLVRLVRTVDGLDEITRSDIDEGGYSFYAICWENGDSILGFVSRVNPMSAIKSGRRFFRYGNTMRAVDQPDFVLSPGADLVVGAEGTAILRPYAFELLLGDVGVSFERVPKDLISVRRALSGMIKLTSEAEEALRSEALRTRSNARRLGALTERLSEISLIPGGLRMSLMSHNVDPELILNDDDEFEFDKDGVKVFFDAVEGRFFEDDFSNEGRRADRFSRR